VLTVAIAPTNDRVIYHFSNTNEKRKRARITLAEVDDASVRWETKRMTATSP